MVIFTLYSIRRLFFILLGATLIVVPACGGSVDVPVDRAGDIPQAWAESPDSETPTEEESQNETDTPPNPDDTPPTDDTTTDPGDSNDSDDSNDSGDTSDPGDSDDSTNTGDSNDTTSGHPTSCDLVLDDCADPILVVINSGFTVFFPAAVNGLDATEFRAMGHSPQIGVGAVVIANTDADPRAQITIY